KLIKKDPDDPDIMDALLAENQKLFNQMSDLLEKQLKEGSGLIRRGQILRLLTDRTVCDQPMVSLMLKHNEPVDLIVGNTNLIPSIAPGKIGLLTVDHKQLLDVVEDIPDCSVGTIERIRHEGTEPILDIATDNHGSGNAVEMRPAWCFPINEASVGKRVYYHGSFVYRIREGETSSFLENQRRHTDFAVNEGEVFGQDQKRFINSLLVCIDLYLNPKDYPARSRENENVFLVYGPEAVGKSESIRCAVTKAHKAISNDTNQATKRELHFFCLPGNAGT
ncbi:hypothetical protein TI05_17325, partial [Achromatium sp. WMS3]